MSRRHIVAACALVSLVAVVALAGWYGTSAHRRAGQAQAVLEEARGEAWLARAELLAERALPYEAYAIGRALAAGSHGESVAARARHVLLSTAPHRAIEIPLGSDFGAVDFTRDGSLAIAFRQGAAVAFDARTGEPVDVPAEAEDPYTARALVRSDRAAAGGRQVRSEGGHVRVYAEHDGELLDEVEVEGGTVTAVALSTDGSVVCAGTTDGRLFAGPVGALRAQWSSATVGGGSVTRITTVPEHRDCDERETFLVASEEGAALRGYIYDPGASDGPLVAVSALTGTHLQAPIVSRNGRTVVVHGTQEVLWWRPEIRSAGPGVARVRVPRTVFVAPNHAIAGVALSPDDRRLAILASRSLWLVDLEPGLSLCDLPFGSGRPLVAVAHVASTVAVGSEHDVVFCDWRGRRRVGGTVSPAGRLGSLALSADGSRLFTIGETIEVWHMAGDRVSELPGAFFDALASDGARAILGGVLVDVQSGERMPLSCPTGGRSGFVLLPGRDAVLGFGERRAAICDLRDGSARATLQGIEHPIGDAGVSPDGRFVWTAHEGGHVRLWDASSGEPLHTMRVGGARVARVQIAPDGRCMLTRSSDGRRRLWDLESGRRIADHEAPALVGYDGPGRPGEAFTGDGTFFVQVDGTRAEDLRVFSASSGDQLWSRHPARPEIEASRAARPFGSGPRVLASSGESLAVLEIGARGQPRSIVRVEPAGAVDIDPEARWLLWDGESPRLIPVGRDAADAAALTADVSNHRVCRDSFDVVTVPPQRLRDPVWAPDDVCGDRAEASPDAR